MVQHQVREESALEAGLIFFWSLFHDLERFKPLSHYYIYTFFWHWIPKLHETPFLLVSTKKTHHITKREKIYIEKNTKSQSKLTKYCVNKTKTACHQSIPDTWMTLVKEKVFVWPHVYNTNQLTHSGINTTTFHITKNKPSLRPIQYIRIIVCLEWAGGNNEGILTMRYC